MLFIFGLYVCMYGYCVNAGGRTREKKRQHTVKEDKNQKNLCDN